MRIEPEEIMLPSGLSKINYRVCSACGVSFKRTDGHSCEEGKEMNNEQNEQWKCECGETVTANGEHLCGWEERFDEKYASVYEAYPESKESHSILLADIKDFIRKERLQARSEGHKEAGGTILNVLEEKMKSRSDALLEAVEILEEERHKDEDCRDDGCGANQVISNAQLSLRKKINTKE